MSFYFKSKGIYVISKLGFIETLANTCNIYKLYPKTIKIISLFVLILRLNFIQMAQRYVKILLVHVKEP